MTHSPGNAQQQPDRAEQFLSYAGIAGVAIAVLLTVAVAALTVAPALIPSGAAIATLVSVLLLAGVVLLVRRIHKQRGREMNPDPDWH
jgi:purine-cytosine permease-like protein